MALRSRDIYQSGDLSRFVDLVEFSMVGLNCVECVSRGHHAVPGAIGFEVVCFRMRNWVSLLKCAQISNLLPAAIRVHNQHPVVGVKQSMGAARTRFQSVESVADESDIGDAADQAADRWTGLTGRQVVRHSRADSLWINLRDACRKASGIGAGAGGCLLALADRRASTAGSTLRNKKVYPIRAKLQSSGIVKSRGKYGDVRGLG